MYQYKFLLLSFYLLTSIALADLKSNNSQLKVDVGNDNSQDAKFTSIGLKIGQGSASANLDVSGNSIVHEKLSIGTGSVPSSNLGLSGTLEVGVQLATSNITTLTSSYILADTSSQDISISLPNPAENPGRIYNIKQIHSSNNVLISTNTFIDDDPAIWLENFGSATLLAQGNVWYLVQQGGTVVKPTWSPTSLSNLIGWYDANDASTITLSGNGITDWTDKSSVGHDLIDGGADPDPIYGTRFLNGRNVIDFTLAGGYMQDSDFVPPASGNLSVFMLSQVENTPETWSGMISMNDDDDWQLQAGTAGAYHAQLTVTNIGGGIGVSTGDYINELHLYEIVFDFDNSTTDRYIDASLDASGTGYNTKISSPNSFKIFSNRSGGASNIAGYCAEVILCEDIDDDSRQRIEGYMMWKWGLADQLPASHPYKEGPPR